MDAPLICAFMKNGADNVPKIVKMMRVDEGERELLAVVLDVPPEQGSRVMLITEDEHQAIVESAVEKALVAVGRSHDDLADRLTQAEAVLRSCLSDYSHPSFTDRHDMASRIRNVLGLPLPN